MQRFDGKLCAADSSYSIDYAKRAIKVCKAAAAGVAAAKPPSVVVAAVTLAPTIGAAGSE